MVAEATGNGYLQVKAAAVSLAFDFAVGLDIFDFDFGELVGWGQNPSSKHFLPHLPPTYAGCQGSR